MVGWGVGGAWSLPPTAPSATIEAVGQANETTSRPLELLARLVARERFLAETRNGADILDVLPTCSNRLMTNGRTNR